MNIGVFIFDSSNPLIQIGQSANFLMQMLAVLHMLRLINLHQLHFRL